MFYSLLAIDVACAHPIRVCEKQRQLHRIEAWTVILSIVESPNSEAFLGSNVFSGRRVGFASFALLSPSQYGDLVLLCSMIRAPAFWCSVCAPCSGDLVLSCSHAPCSMLHALVILCSHAHVLGVLVLSCSCVLVQHLCSMLG